MTTNEILEHYDMRDIDLDTLHRYRTLFRFKNDGHVWNEIDDKTFLRNLGGCVVDRETGRETLTVAGLMMFGTGLAVRERFANFRMDYINMCNLIGDERYSDRLTYDGRWENNLYQFFSIVLPKMTFDLPRPFRMVGVQRDDDTPQHKAVREAFTNSLIHADLMMDAGVSIERTAKRASESGKKSSKKSDKKSSKEYEALLCTISKIQTVSGQLRFS